MEIEKYSDLMEKITHSNRSVKNGFFSIKKPKGGYTHIPLELKEFLYENFLYKFEEIIDFCRVCAGVLIGLYGDREISYRLKFENKEKTELELGIEKVYHMGKFPSIKIILHNNNHDGIKEMFKNFMKTQTKCFELLWFPWKKMLYLNYLLYSFSTRFKFKNYKLDPSKDCSIKNAPKNIGSFFLDFTKKIGKTYNCKNIFLMDASYIFIKNVKVELSLFYIKKHGVTFYMKYDYKPIKGNLNFQDIITDKNTPEDRKIIKEIKNDLDKIKTDVLKDPKKWNKEVKNLGINEKLPEYYFLKL